MLPYFGNIAFWRDIILRDFIEINTSFTIPKKSYSNRTVISTANGLQTLSVPLEGGRGSRLPYNQVRISHQDRWLDIHRMALKSAYSKSPYYDDYIHYFDKIWNHSSVELAVLNEKIFHEICRLLKINLDLKIIDDKNYLLGNYIPNLFDLNLASYPQVFRYKFSFYPDLSILDVLFCLGPATKKYLIENNK